LENLEQSFKKKEKKEKSKKNFEAKIRAKFFL